MMVASLQQPALEQNTKLPPESSIITP